MRKSILLVFAFTLLLASSSAIMTVFAHTSDWYGGGYRGYGGLNGFEGFDGFKPTCFVVPEIPIIGALGAMLAMFGGLAINMKRKPRL